MPLLVDTPKVNARYDSDKELLDAINILHENKEINTLAVENKELQRQIKTLRNKLNHRELENEHERLKNEVRSLEAKLKPENTEKVKKKCLEKANAQNDKDQKSVENQNNRKLMKLHDHVLLIASTSKIALSNIIRRHDLKKRTVK